MGSDLLNVSANQRVDLVDFEFLADEGLQANVREPNANLMTNPGGLRKWILEGFAMSNPAGEQLQVTKGRGLLGSREGAQVHYGMLTVEGDTSKTIDMGVLSDDANWGVYIRFEYNDGDSASRIFWNPAGTGSELSQSVPTRRLANWSLRVELSNPGSEWLKIGTVDNTGGTLVITDERPFFFEGVPDDSYQSGWSTEGGGVANDRNADRALYGVHDFQSFTAAMRQCVEDIRGRGLRRWWEKGIGGLNVGFDTDPTEGEINLVDTNFKMWNTGTSVGFDVEGSTNSFWYDRSANEFYWEIAGTTELKVAAGGVSIPNDLFLDSRVLTFGPDGSNDHIDYDDTGKDFSMWIDGGEEYTFGNSALDMHSNEIDNCGNIDGSGDITMGSITMTGAIYTTGKLGRDATDYLQWTDNTQLGFWVNNSEEMRLVAGGLSITNGLYVGSVSGSPTDNKVYAEGDVEAGAYLRAAGRLYLGSNDYMVWDNTNWDLLLEATRCVRHTDTGQHIFSTAPGATFEQRIVMMDGGTNQDPIMEIIGDAMGEPDGYQGAYYDDMRPHIRLSGAHGETGAPYGSRDCTIEFWTNATDRDSATANWGFHGWVGGYYAAGLTITANHYADLQICTGDRMIFNVGTGAGMENAGQMEFYAGDGYVGSAPRFMEVTPRASYTQLLLGESNGVNHSPRIALRNYGTGASDPGTVALYGYLYTKVVASKAEVYVKDGNGTVTLISPHDEDGNWVHDEVSDAGVRKKVNMERLVALVEQLSGETLMEISQI